MSSRPGNILNRLASQGLPVFFASRGTLSPKPDVIQLSGEEARHVACSRRLRPGCRIILNDGMGLCVRAVVVACARKGVEVKAEEYFSTENDLLPIEIACPVIKGERMDWAVAKAAELGVAIIHPVYTEYCVVKQDEGKDARRLARWRILCREALKQSRGNFMTAVSEPGRLEDFVSSRGDDGAAIVMWEGEGSVDMRAAWREQDNRLPLVLFVGPEGGFSKKEIEMFRQRGYSTASCGARILRSETAVISAVSLFSQLV